MKFTEEEKKLIKKIDKNNQAWKYSRYFILLVCLILGTSMVLVYNEIKDIMRINRLNYGTDYIREIEPYLMFNLLMFMLAFFVFLGVVLIIRWNSGNK